MCRYFNARFPWTTKYDHISPRTVPVSRNPRVTKAANFTANAQSYCEKDSNIKLEATSLFAQQSSKSVVVVGTHRALAH